MELNKDKIKQSLSLEQIAELVDELGGESLIQDGFLTAKTICHNTFEEEGSHKLYYYDNTKLFHCYTNCGSFDIFELICKVKNINGQFKAYTKEGKICTREWDLPDAMYFVISFFSLDSSFYNSKTEEKSAWNDYFNKCEKINLTQDEQKVELSIYDDSVLKHLPHPHIAPWEREGIKYEVLMDRGIAFDPISTSIIIPHYNIDNQLIGIRSRTLIKEDEIYGKYRPAIFGGKMFNHPLGFNLYNINNSADTIRAIKRVIVFEGEKSPLLFGSYFGMDNDCCVSVCGSSFTNYQYSILKSLGVEEIIIAFDRQYQEVGYKDEEWVKWTKKLKDIHNRFGAETQISYIFDKEHLLDYKDSPIDKGPDTFMKLFQERVII